MQVLADEHDSEIPDDTLRQVEAGKRSIEFLDGKIADCDARCMSEYKKIKHDSFCPYGTLQTLGHKIDGECRKEVELQILTVEDGHKEHLGTMPHCKMPWYATKKKIVLVGHSMLAYLRKCLGCLTSMTHFLISIASAG